MIHIIILLMTSSLSWNWNSNENFKVENFINLELILHIIVTSQNSNDNGWPRIPRKFKIFENILDMKKCPTQSVGGTKFVLRFNFWIFFTENSTFYRNIVRNVRYIMYPFPSSILQRLTSSVKPWSINLLFWFSLLILIWHFFNLKLGWFV